MRKAFEALEDYYHLDVSPLEYFSSYF